MRKIKNPFTEREGYNCFGCSPENPFGLKLNFYEEDEFVVSEWTPGNNFQGFSNVLHGGVQSTLMDEIASWTVFTKLKTAGVTKNLEVEFKRPAFTTDSKIILKASLGKMNDNLAEIIVNLYDSKYHLCSTGRVYYFTFPEDKARTKLKYPGIEAFYEND